MAHLQRSGRGRAPQRTSDTNRVVTYTSSAVYILTLVVSLLATPFYVIGGYGGMNPLLRFILGVSGLVMAIAVSRNARRNMVPSKALAWTAVILAIYTTLGCVFGF